MQSAAFKYGGELVRGAAAAVDIKPSIVCSIVEGAFVSLASVQHILSQSFVGRPQLLEIASLFGEAREHARR